MAIMFYGCEEGPVKKSCARKSGVRSIERGDKPKDGPEEAKVLATPLAHHSP